MVFNNIQDSKVILTNFEKNAISGYVETGNFFVIQNPFSFSAPRWKEDETVLPPAEVRVRKAFR
jgi:hypothetical protein